MSLIGKNIRKIRSVKKLSQTAFADLFSLSRTSVGAYEEERAEPKIDTIIQIANHFGISVDGLLTKELTVNELFHFDIFHDKVVQEEPIGVSGTVSYDNEIGYVSGKALLEYVTQRKNKDFLKQLAAVVVPGIDGKDKRAFEVKGSEMAVGPNGLLNGDFVVCEKIEVSKAAIRDVHVFVTSNQVMVRRLVEKGVQLSLDCDNVSYSTIQLAKKEVEELWRVIGVFKSSVAHPQPLEARVASLEDLVTQLQKKLK